MRLFRLGSLRKNNKIGIRVFVLDAINPFSQIFNAIRCVIDYKKMGLVRFIKILGLRATIVLNLNRNGEENVKEVKN